GRWLDSPEQATRAVLAQEVEVPEITRERVRVAIGTPAAVRQATSGLAGLEQTYAAQHDAPHLVEILALRALAARARGDLTEARTALERAIALGQPGGFVRTFVDLGAPMAALLGAVADQLEDTPYLRRLRAALERRAQPTATATAPAADV